MGKTYRRRKDEWDDDHSTNVSQKTKFAQRKDKRKEMIQNEERTEDSSRDRERMFERKI
tara:strand:+ start:881 stop:1057 length:177 start_codon:yes stop_codon:yes gene_type:complete